MARAAARAALGGAGEEAPRSLASLLPADGPGGATPGPLTASARWKSEADIPARIYFRALEALGGG